MLLLAVRMATVVARPYSTRYSMNGDARASLSRGWCDLVRLGDAPKAIRVFHHKTGAVVLHPLQDGDGTLFYGDAEEVLAKVPRRGIPMIHRTRSAKTDQALFGEWHGQVGSWLA
jgi:hypothetical protein